MSFEQMKKTELLEMATEQFGVDVKEDMTKAQIIAELEAQGVTWAMAKAFDPAAAAYEPEEREVEVVEVVKPVVEVVQPVVVEEVVLPEKVVVKMDRNNPTYEIRGVKFTTDHPYGLMSKEDAEYVVENVEGFSLATPKEVQSYYR